MINKRKESNVSEENQEQQSKKLDYTIQDPLQRAQFVGQFIADLPKEQLTEKYIEVLSDYIIFAMDKKEKKEKFILTENRMITVNKRETSFQGLASKFENGEDGIYNLMIEDKNVLLTPKISITEKDIAEIQPLQQLKEAIEQVREQEKKATGKRKYLLKKQLIEMCQDQYVIKTEYKPPLKVANVVKSFVMADLSDDIEITADMEPVNHGLLSFFDPKHISALLCNYSALKQEAYSNFMTDCYYMMEDLDNLIERALKGKYPLYYDLLIYKIDGKSNAEIQEIIEQDYNIKHTVEYISALWRNKIPKLLAEQEKKDYLIWYYSNKEYGKWKRCSKCGEYKLANNNFFSKNKTAKDGYYSICKECRNKKPNQEKRGE